MKYLQPCIYMQLSHGIEVNLFVLRVSYVTKQYIASVFMQLQLAIQLACIAICNQSLPVAKVQPMALLQHRGWTSWNLQYSFLLVAFFLLESCMQNKNAYIQGAKRCMRPIRSSRYLTTYSYVYLAIHVTKNCDIKYLLFRGCHASKQLLIDLMIAACITVQLHLGS